MLTVGLSSVMFAAAADSVESLPTAVSMGTVVLALLGLEHFRQKQAAARETALMSRVASLEDAAQEKLLALIERQLQSSIKQDQALLRMSEVLNQLVDGQAAVKRIMEQFADERPCLLKTEAGHRH